MTSRAKKILQLIAEQNSSESEVENDGNVEQERLNNELLPKEVVQNVLHSDEDSETDPYANSSEDDPDYAPSDIGTDSDVESISQVFDNESDAEISLQEDRDDDGESSVNEDGNDAGEFIKYQ